MNALTGNTSAWNGIIGKRVRDAGYGYLTYNFRGQINSSFEESINLTSEIIISDLLKLIDHLNLKILYFVDYQLVVYMQLLPH